MHCPQWRTTTTIISTHSINDIEKKYYADGENAYDMRKWLKPRKGSHKGTLAEAPSTPQREEDGVQHDLEHGRAT